MSGPHACAGGSLHAFDACPHRPFSRPVATWEKKGKTPLFKAECRFLGVGSSTDNEGNRRIPYTSLEELCFAEWRDEVQTTLNKVLDPCRPVSRVYFPYRYPQPVDILNEIKSKGLCNIDV